MYPPPHGGEPIHQVSCWGRLIFTRRPEPIFIFYANFTYKVCIEISAKLRNNTQKVTRLYSELLCENYESGQVKASCVECSLWIPTRCIVAPGSEVRVSVADYERKTIIF